MAETCGVVEEGGMEGGREGNREFGGCRGEGCDGGVVDIEFAGRDSPLSRYTPFIENTSLHKDSAWLQVKRPYSKGRFISGI